MEMDTFRGVLILHFLSMITPQYHHIFFILWNSLSFSSAPACLGLSTEENLNLAVTMIKTTKGMNL